MSDNDKAKILLAISKIVEIQHNAKEVHFEIESSVRSFQQELNIPRRMPEFYQMSMEFEQKDNENIKLLEQLRPLIKINLIALNPDYISNYIAYTSILENMLFNARLIHGYIEIIKKDYIKLKIYFVGNDDLQIIASENISAFLNGPRFMSLQTGISDTYKSLLIIIREEVEKRNKAGVEFDFIAELRKETMYNKYIKAFVKLNSFSINELSQFQTITFNALKDAYVFQRNKIIKDIYCSIEQTKDPDAHALFGEVLSEFEKDKNLLESIIPSQINLEPRFNNFTQYFPLYPFNTVATSQQTLVEVLNELEINIDLDTSLPLLTQLNEIQKESGLAIIVLNKYPSDNNHEFIAVYHNVYDPATRDLNKEKSEKIKKIKSLDYQLSTISGFLYKNSASLRSDRAILQQEVDALTNLLDKGLSTKKANLRKNVGAVDFPVPITLEPSSDSKINDVVLFNPLNSPNGYVVLFMAGDNNFEILKDENSNGIFRLFVDIPETTGLYKLLRERYSLNQLSFIEPSRYLNATLNEFERMNDSLQTINSGYESFLAVYKNKRKKQAAITHVENINDYIKDNLNKTDDIKINDSEILKMMIYERLFVRYMNALRDSPLYDVLIDTSQEYKNKAEKYIEITGNEFSYEKTIQEMENAFLSAIKNASIDFVLKFDKMFLKDLSSKDTKYLIQIKQMQDINKQFNIELFMNKFYSFLRINMQRLNDFIVSQQLQNDTLVKLHKINQNQCNKMNELLQKL